MPLIVTVPVGSLVCGILYLLFGDCGKALFSGFVIGYVVYDLVHYFCHQRQFSSGIMGRLRRHHLVHHFAKPDQNFAVSNTFWDYVFSTKSVSKRQH